MVLFEGVESNGEGVTLDLQHERLATPYRTSASRPCIEQRSIVQNLPKPLLEVGD
jgi:hypothetical protein